VTLLGFEANAIVIAGTGSVVLLHDTQGQIHQAGGQEWVACDQGAGFWIGLRAIREAYRDFEDGRESVLLQRLRQEFGVRSDEPKALKAKLRQLAVADKEMKKEIARFAFLVCGAAERGDASSQNIIKDEAESLADMTAGGLRRTFTRDELIKGVRIVQVGSLLGNEFYRLAFEAQVQRRLLAGVKQQAVLNWHRVATAVEATLCLAQRLANDSESMLNIDPEFRPIILSSE
jgi:Predicted N-acetylglucosamine kinase